MGRVVILQGPLAVKHSRKVNEPIADVLNGIHDTWVSFLQGTESHLHTAEYLSTPVPEAILSAFPNLARNLKIELLEKLQKDEKSQSVKSAQLISVTLPSEKKNLPEPEVWFEWLSGGQNSWWRALLTSPHIVQGKKYVDNAFKRLLNPSVNQKYHIKSLSERWGEEVVEVVLFDEAITAISEELQNQPIVKIRRNNPGSSEFSVEVYHPCPTFSPTSADKASGPLWKMVPLTLRYLYTPVRAYASISQIMPGRNEEVKRFYSQLWFGDKFEQLESDLSKEEPLSAKFSNIFTLKRHHIENFSAAIGREINSHNGEKLQAPVDFAIVASWESVIKSLFLKQVDGNLLQLVHLSNGFKLLPSCPSFFTEGDVIETTLEIVEMKKIFSGLRIGVVGQMAVKNSANPPFLEIRSEFLFRGNEFDLLDAKDKAAAPPAFFEKRKDVFMVTLSSKEDLAIIQSKPWIQWNSVQLKDGLKLGDRIVLKFESQEFIVRKQPTSAKTKPSDSLEEEEQPETKNIAVHGAVYKLNGPSSFVPTVADLESSNLAELFNTVGSISYEKQGVSDNVVRSFVQRFGNPLEPSIFFANGGYQLLGVADQIVVPSESLSYALSSGDLNPIHTNKYFTVFGELPFDTITHGMWTSANARRVIESFVAQNRPERVMDFSTEFVGMVKPREKLFTFVRHVGMKNGRMLVEIETKNEKNEVVLRGTADVKSPKTCYVFTGQGSATVGMGMDLYSSSSIAKEIWDAADTYFLENYGFSILNIVKDNPKEITIYFGGKKGRKIRKNYQKLTSQVQEEEFEGETKSNKTVVRKITEKPLFPDITDLTASYVFKHPEGLLFATQFSQPALVLMELSAFEDMYVALILLLIYNLYSKLMMLSFNIF